MKDPVARHGRVIALEHDVADGARRAGAARDQRDEPVARDPAAWDVAYHGKDTRSPAW